MMRNYSKNPKTLGFFEINYEFLLVFVVVAYKYLNFTNFCLFFFNITECLNITKFLKFRQPQLRTKLRNRKFLVNFFNCHKLNFFDDQNYCKKKTTKVCKNQRLF